MIPSSPWGGRHRSLGPALSGEEPRYLELATEPARRRFEDLGFRRAGCLATQSISKAEPEVVQFRMSRPRAVLSWAALIVGFTVVWHFLSR